MKNNTNENEMLLKIALGGLAVGYGLARYKGMITLGLIAYAAYSMKNFQIKEFIEGLTTKQFANAEVNRLPIDDNDVIHSHNL